MPDKDKIAIEKDLRVLKTFFDIYCRNKHTDRERTDVNISGLIKMYFNLSFQLCDECKRHFIYAAAKRILCPYNPKPACKKCPTICYSDEHRSFMKDMMKFSGKYLITHGRLDLIFKYLF